MAAYKQWRINVINIALQMDYFIFLRINFLNGALYGLCLFFGYTTGQRILNVSEYILSKIQTAKI